MKHKLLCIFTLFAIFTFIITVNASSQIINESKSLEYDIASVSAIINTEEGYLILGYNEYNLTIYKYDNNDKLISTKEFQNLKQANIIKYNDNYLLAGINSNTLKVYLIDSNLQVKSQTESSIYINSSSYLNLYNDNDLIYIMITEDNILTDSNIYEIDSSLNITSNKLSSYNANELKKILSSSYYLIHTNDVIKDNQIIHYNDSTYTEENNFLVGNISNTTYNEILGYEEKAIITILDKDGNYINQIENSNYTNYTKVVLVNDKIILLAEKDSNVYMVFYDLEGNFISEEELNFQSTPSEVSIHKLSNNLIISIPNQTIEKNTTYLKFYSYELTITTEESIYGTLEVTEVASPNELVTFNITPNSGYSVETITIKDFQGNVIESSENTFTMPENGVVLSVTYKETVSNPETIDIILFLGILLLTIFIISIILYRKINWLK